MEKAANGKKEQVDQFLEDLAGWVGSQNDLLAAALVGSYARGAATPDSDVDIILISSHLTRIFISKTVHGRQILA